MVRIDADIAILPGQPIPGQRVDILSRRIARGIAGFQGKTDAVLGTADTATVDIALCQRGTCMGAGGIEQVGLALTVNQQQFDTPNPKSPSVSLLQALCFFKRYKGHARLIRWLVDIGFRVQWIAAIISDYAIAITTSKFYASRPYEYC